MLAWCATAGEFRQRIKEALDHYGLDIGEIEDAEPLRLRLSKRAVNAELLHKAEEVETTHRVRFNEPIYSYPWDERED